jgi:hypothetical protein
MERRSDESAVASAPTGSTRSGRPARASFVLLLVAIPVYLSLAAGTAHSLRPWFDEGQHAAPAWSLAFRGSMGTPCLVAPALKDINRYTYWIMPVDPLIQVAWYRVFSFGLTSMRALSVLCGLIGLLAWASVFRYLTKDIAGTFLFLVVMACDYVSLTGAASGRPDIMALAFQAGAFAAYLRWREVNLALAILLSQSLVVASGLTHPNGGMLSFLGALWLTLYFDRKRIRALHIGLAVLPYLVGAVAWGFYIAQDPSAFASQYGFQISERSHIFWNPWKALRSEFTMRYIPMMGLGGHSPGSAGPHFLKSLIFVAYGVSIAGLLLNRPLRQQTATRVVIGFIALDFLFLTLLEGNKATYYFIYAVYPISAALVLFSRWCWRSFKRGPLLVACSLAGLLAVQIGGDVFRIRRDAWHKEFMPAVAFMQARARPGDLIVGSHELGFFLGYGDSFVDDGMLGLDTGRTPSYIFLEEIYNLRFDAIRERQPREYARLEDRLKDYQVIYNQTNYRVLALHSGAGRK